MDNMFFTKSSIYKKALVITLFLFTIRVSSVSALTLPFVGQVSLGGDNQEEERTAHNIDLDVLFGYRSTPQFYNANLDTIEVRSLIVNRQSGTETGQFEAKVYKLTELWDTKTHDISYDQRTAYIHAQPRDEQFAFSEEQLINIVNSERRCIPDQPANSAYAPPCYHEENSEDNNQPYGGYQLETKPDAVIISDEVTLEANERMNLVFDWVPQECGYYQVLVQPFGYQREDATDMEGDRSRQAYVRVKGCEDGAILEDGAVTPPAENGDVLPATSAGLLWYLLPAIGLVTGGLLLNRGTREFDYF